MAWWRRRAVLVLAVVAFGCGRREGKAPRPEKGKGEGAGTEDRAGVEAFWASWKKAVSAGDGRALWTLTSASDRRAVSEKMKASAGKLPDGEWRVLAALTGLDEGRLRAMTPEMLAEETTVAMLGKLREQPAELAKVEGSELTGVTFDGERATIRFRLTDGKDLSMVAVREGESWKADLAATARSGGRR